MTPLANSEDRYGAVAIALHWLVAALLVALVAVGLYMVRLPDAGFDTLKIEVILWHKELGMLALVLALSRLSWRVTNVLPRLVEHLPDWEKVAARFVHLTFYGLMLALPISGWLMSSAAGFPVSLLGLFDLPDLVLRDDYLYRVFVAVHKVLAYAIIGLAGIHAGAALRHHFFFRDDTLRRMLPRSRAPGEPTLSPPTRERTRRDPSTP